MAIRDIVGLKSTNGLQMLQNQENMHKFRETKSILQCSGGNGTMEKQDHVQQQDQGYEKQDHVFNY